MHRIRKQRTRVVSTTNCWACSDSSVTGRCEVMNVEAEERAQLLSSHQSGSSAVYGRANWINRISASYWSGLPVAPRILCNGATIERKKNTNGETVIHYNSITKETAGVAYTRKICRFCGRKVSMRTIKSSTQNLCECTGSEQSWHCLPSTMDIALMSLRKLRLLYGSAFQILVSKAFIYRHSWNSVLEQKTLDVQDPSSYPNNDATNDQAPSYRNSEPSTPEWRCCESVEKEETRKLISS